MIVLMPARCAPSTFSFTPPIGSTRPRSVISPVIATSRALCGSTSRSRARWRSRCPRGTVLRNGTRGHVDVRLDRAEPVARDAEQFAALFVA
jgi:hypothetical protein